MDSGRMFPPTPRLWTLNELDFDYDPEAKCPFWKQWLDEVFAGDAESQECIEEQLGYGMTGDVQFHKAFLWIGQKGREGKGTLAHVLEHLCGSEAHVSLGFNDWLKGEYAKEVLIGKKAGIFPDVRLKPGKWWGQSYDAGGLDHASKEQMLRISGGDTNTIRLKWRSLPWRGVLPMKLFLLCNSIPNVNDTNLATRFIHIAFPVSFRGREDVTIPNRLKAELPGIANRCLKAYRRLLARGRFIQPAGGLELAREIARAGYPFKAFMEDCCVLDGDGSVRHIIMLSRLRQWCVENGETDLLKRETTPTHLSKKLKEYIKRENIEGLNLDPYRAGGDEPRVWLGDAIEAD